MKPKKPNVLGAGFPKCGTTYLYHLLKQHPDIHLPSCKELNYFNKDHFFLGTPEIPNPRYFKPKRWYYSFFNSHKKIKIDISILTAYDITAAKRIKKELGDIKIIFMVRDKQEHQKSLKNYLRLEHSYYPEYESYYNEYSDFEYYMNFYKKLFSKVYILSLEKLKSNPQKELDKLARFLEIKKHRFNLNVYKHASEHYKMRAFQLLKRKAYLNLIKIFYFLVSLTVRLSAKPEDY